MSRGVGEGEADRRERVRVHLDMRRLLTELLPDEAAGDVFDLATLAVAKGLAQDALRAACALGGVHALKDLIRRSDP